MRRNHIIGVVAVVIVVAGAAFYGGTVYGKSGSGSRAQFAAGQFPGGAAGFAGRTGGGRTGTAAGGFTAGDIVSTADGSISIKMQNGSSTELVLIGPNTQIVKSVSGSASDLTVGAGVTVTGTTNSDGSLSASSIQIRPAGAAGFTGRPQGTQAQ